MRNRKTSGLHVLLRLMVGGPPCTTHVRLTRRYEQQKADADATLRLTGPRRQLYESDNQPQQHHQQQHQGGLLSATGPVATQLRAASAAVLRLPSADRLAVEAAEAARAAASSSLAAPPLPLPLQIGNPRAKPLAASTSSSSSYKLSSGTASSPRRA